MVNLLYLNLKANKDESIHCSLDKRGFYLVCNYKLKLIQSEFID